MRKITIILLAVLLLAGCGAQQTAPTTTETTVAPTTLPPMVDIGGTEILAATEALDLTALEYEMGALLRGASELTQVTAIELGCTQLTAQEIATLQEAFPAAQISYTLSLFGQELTVETTELDLSDRTPADTDEIARVAALLPKLEHIEFVNDDGVCVFTLETIGQLDKIRAAAPQARFGVSFDLFGQTVTDHDERIEYYLVPIGNDGVAQVRAVLPYLSSCTYLLLEGCEIDNEVMAQLRADFAEQTKVVWRVWTAGPFYGNKEFTERCGFLTDTELIRTVAVSDSTSHVFKYCNEVKYVDFGHNDYISDFSFFTYMPDLEVAIIAITQVTDITPLASCPKLEYLEVFSTAVADLSPLANCKELKHLNISNMKNLTDLSPLFGLDKLERLRIVMCDGISKEQLEEVAEKLPNCDVMTKGWDPTEDGWRRDANKNYVPRYALLREQMQYGDLPSK